MLDSSGMSYPHSDDPLVQAVQRLLEIKGGHVAVGAAAGISDQSLYQIAEMKTDSKTGKPKSVGPSIRRRLSVAFPGWMNPALETAGQSEPTDHDAQIQRAIVALNKIAAGTSLGGVVDILELMARRGGSGVLKYETDSLWRPSEPTQPPTPADRRSSGVGRS